MSYHCQMVTKEMRSRATSGHKIGSNPRMTQNAEFYPTLEKNHQEKSGGGDKNLMVEKKQNEEIKGKEIEADNSVSSIQISEGVEGKASTNDSDCEREEETERTEVKKNMKKGCRKRR